jgi:hypothetical protein
MNDVHRIGRSLTSLTRRAVVLLACHAAPACRCGYPEPRVGVRRQAPRQRLRTGGLPVRLPHTFQLCIHCRERPAGFWVSRAGATTVRRPWCLSCCEGLDCDCRVIPFDG